MPALTLADNHSTDEAERVLIGEIYLPYPQLVSYYGDESGPELHLPCNFKLITDALPDWRAPVLHSIIEEYESSISKEQWPNWVLGNHDRTRIASHLGGEIARSAMMLLLTLRGTPTIYFGDELGLPDRKIESGNDKDPCAQNGGAVTGSRSPARAPMLWTTEAFGGFSKVSPWLPSYESFDHLSVEHQLQDPGSMLSLTKSLLQLRRQEPALSQGALKLGDRHKHLLLFERTYGERRLKIALNFSEEPIEQIYSGRLIFSSQSRRVNIPLRLLRLKPFEGAIIQCTSGVREGGREGKQRVIPAGHHMICKVH